ncbi:flavin reductase family protein [Nocardiopsis sp. EMB25]|uniref:flavin reductase family protein n=1 Tax=Nocardiopsis sp. EMB25 TaxID=2835867 RepID=UPI0022850F20|nr:flavin reductase family protein [Nocardiopsis sp. EMB25]MCY9787072.1 flavin reductase family protein [Nocardiopsis sp. EMB25]
MTPHDPTPHATDVRSEPTALRDGLARMATSVSVITTEVATGRHGFTANSVVSVSADPPLIGVFLATTAECHAAFAHARTLAVNVLADGQEHLSTLFATRGADKFGSTGFVRGGLGAPILPDAAVTLEGSVHSRHAAGDHTMILVDVARVRRGDSAPLIYQGRRFRRLVAA